MTDVTRCKVCGGEFSTKRIHINGGQYHPACAVSSFAPHTHDDVVRLGERIAKLEAALRMVITAVEDNDDDVSDLRMDVYKSAKAVLGQRQE